VECAPEQSALFAAPGTMSAGELGSSSSFRRCHFPKSASAIGVEKSRFPLPKSTAILPKVICNVERFAKLGGNLAQDRGAMMVDMTLVPETAWRLRVAGRRNRQLDLSRGGPLKRTLENR